MSSQPLDRDAEDRALLAAHVRGDPDAFGTLFRRHRDRLWAVAVRSLGDPEDAADALQDALVAAFRRADSYRGDAAVTTWLHRIVVNACLDLVRRRRVRRAEPLPERPDLHDTAVLPRGVGLSVTPVAAEDPLEAAERSELQRAVLAALARLPDEQRMPLVLVDMEGLSVQEAAALLGVPVGTVKSRCSRGRARLRSLLTGGTAPPAGNPERPRRVPSPGAAVDGEEPGSAGGGDA